MISNEILPLPANSELLHDFSRFADQLLFSSNGVPFWGTWIQADIPFGPADAYHTVSSRDVGRLDLISYKFYQTPELWWVLAAANGIFFPPEDMQEGDVLRIPDKSGLILLGFIR